MVQDPRQTIIDMTPDGRFVETRQAGPAPLWAFRATGIAAIATVLGGALLGLALALWLAITILPTVLAVAVVALLAARFRRR